MRLPTLRRQVHPPRHRPRQHLAYRSQSVVIDTLTQQQVVRQFLCDQ